MSRLIPFAKNHVGGSRGFRRAHREALRRTLRALGDAEIGCAYAPSFDNIKRAKISLQQAILNCKEENWT